MEWSSVGVVFAGILLALGVMLWNLSSYWRKMTASRSGIEVNCWFCGEKCRVMQKKHNSWWCPNCDQYNGFTEDGGYNIQIPQMHISPDSTPSHERHRNSHRRYHHHHYYYHQPQDADAVKYNSHISNNPNILCSDCTRNQSTILQRWAAYNPSEDQDSGLDDEAERRMYNEYRSRLERIYPLCRRCKLAVERQLAQVQHRLDQQQFLNNINHSERLAKDAQRKRHFLRYSGDQKRVRSSLRWDAGLHRVGAVTIAITGGLIGVHAVQLLTQWIDPDAAEVTDEPSPSDGHQLWQYRMAACVIQLLICSALSLGYISAVLLLMLQILFGTIDALGSDGNVWRVRMASFICIMIVLRLWNMNSMEYEECRAVLRGTNMEPFRKRTKNRLSRKRQLDDIDSEKENPSHALLNHQRAKEGPSPSYNTVHQNDKTGDMFLGMDALGQSLFNSERSNQRSNRRASAHGRGRHIGQEDEDLPPTADWRIANTSTRAIPPNHSTLDPFGVRSNSSSGHPKIQSLNHRPVHNHHRRSTSSTANDNQLFAPPSFRFEYKTDFQQSERELDDLVLPGISSFSLNGHKRTNSENRSNFDDLSPFDSSKRLNQNQSMKYRWFKQWIIVFGGLA
eukprot:gb/GECH01008918.1/.p1 GENE.gb/GECH01008918.1/~~gb/GECH01008918.1/.p1  ORF type:complete len:621 (+),score=115.16 gb/GECH01008918.1/:1-1863(+)